MSGYAGEFARIALAHFLAMASPGPDFAVVLRQSLSRGRKEGMLTALGIGTGNGVHVTYSLFGLGLLLHRAPGAFTAVKWCGAGYLAWLGIQCLRARSPLEPAAAAPASGRSPASAFRVGFITNALNPKCTLFFVAFFATLVRPTTPVSVRLLYGAWICLATAAWFAFVATAFTHEPIRRRFLRCGPWIDRALGVVFIAFAILLVSARLA